MNTAYTHAHALVEFVTDCAEVCNLEIITTAAVVAVVATLAALALFALVVAVVDDFGTDNN